MAKLSKDVIYEFVKTRQQRSRLFVNMAIMCLLYNLGLSLYVKFGSVEIPESFRLIAYWVFSVASLVFFYIAYWHRKHPATYRALVTKERLIVEYPQSEQWSFNIAIEDIERFESRQSLSHAGSGVMQTGVLLSDGRFYSIPVNYGLNLGKLHKAIKTIRPELEFPTKVNKRIEGFLAKDYDR
ncbi:hypothetical protein QTP81_00330 [Alteromonas sp. ASW11-36]|uniref:DUF304 domain-containing protein n=1 Tax=Alteromonas arenosi TaxID=3055817 RepID=A0ABT7SS83_9ALTE|nr:hypothetical protein [Alteromonas sp. ASW11-36]MDM7859047.1 hypothetical protein [Alteromonas sp. ASW11-36]